MSGIENRVTSALNPFLQQATEEVFPAAAVHIYHNGETIYQQATGWLDPARRSIAASLDTLFDLASLTKLFTTTAFLRLVAAGKVELDDAVSNILPAFKGERPILPYEDPLRPGDTITAGLEGSMVNAGVVTFRQLLTHTSGLPAWRPYYRLSREEIPTALLDTFFAYPTGEKIIYSDLGFMLLGLAIARLASYPLDAVISQRVLEVLGISRVWYGPVLAEQAAPTEKCAWRKRRIQGEVHDENAWAMGGAAGHAGLFGTASAVARFGQAWLDICQGTDQWLTHELAAEATRLQAEDGTIRRGLGWAIWSPDPESPSHPLSSRAFGHTGFTGTSLYIDPERALVIACLTNAVYYGRETRKIGGFRTALHERAVEAL